MSWWWPWNWKRSDDEQPAVEVAPQRTTRKIVVVGDSCGKTALRNVFTGVRFETGELLTTLKIEFWTKETRITGCDDPVRLQIWEFGARWPLRGFQLRGTDVVMLAFDITRASSFEIIQQRLAEVLAHADMDHVKIVVVGNKLDLEHQREVSREQAEDWCSENDLTYYETSAKHNINVEQAFMCQIDKQKQWPEEGYNDMPPK